LYCKDEDVAGEEERERKRVNLRNLDAGCYSMKVVARGGIEGADLVKNGGH
jgi:hypothetical protein